VDALDLILYGAVGMALVMASAWAAQWLSGNAGWVDVAWSFGTGLLGLTFALVPEPGAPGISWRQLVIAALVGFWSLRLGSHIATRVAHGPEDARYAALRESWGGQFQSRMFLFLEAQALCAVLLGVAVLLAARNPAPNPRLIDIAGLALLAFAILGERSSDMQLELFKADANNRGRVCDTGFWSWSRHPNYFFEWLGWLAYPLLAISWSGDYPWGWLALLGPALMYALLVYVSGIPPVEAHMLRSRGAAYRDYQRRTSAFFPLPPRRSAAKVAESP